jgi:tetratricopeptide (TPR) repeat protein
LFVFAALVAVLLPRWSPAARTVSPDGRTVVRLIRVNDYNNVATAHFRLGNREEAVAVLEEARLRYPWEESVVLRLATAYAEEKAFEKADAVLEEYLAAGGAGWRARLLLADVRARTGRIDEARGLVREVLRQDPENRTAREMLERL